MAPAYLKAEYKAYYYQAFDLVQKTNWELVTGFDPKSYLRTFGPQGTIHLVIKASWICHGNTAYKKVCPLPPALAPRFQAGQAVTINLPSNQAHGYEGIVEIAFWRKDLKSNIYGVKLSDDSSLYGLFYEKNLE